MIGALASGAFGVAKEWLGNRKARAKAKGELKLAEINNRTRLLADKNSNNHSWEMASLKSSGLALKWASFSLFSLPILFTVVAPFFGEAGNAAVAEMWANFGRVPEGWLQVYFTITGSIWGIAAMKDVAPGLVSGVAQAFKRGKKDA